MVRLADVPDLTANALYPDLGDDEPLATTVRRQMCREGHEQALRTAVKDGRVTPLNPHSFVPEAEWEGAQLMRAVMTRDDFTRFAGQLFVRVDLAATVSPTLEPAVRQQVDADEPAPTKNWILQVQAEATKRYKALLRGGAKPNPNNMARDLHSWCVDNQVLTEWGAPPEIESIRKYALRRSVWKPPSID